MNINDLHNYQVNTVNHLVKNTHCGAFLEMGLGKTVSSLTAVNILMFEELAIGSVLVVAPKRVATSVWSAEIEKWEHLRHLTLVKITGDVKQRKEALRKKANIYTIGRDNFNWLCGIYGGSMLPFDMVIVDESTSFKNHQAIKFKAFKLVRNSIKRIVLLTGTPAPNGIMDLWSQIYLLDQGERLGQFITDFRNNYFSRKFSGFGYDIRPNAQEIIQHKIKDIVISMKAEDYLELPGRITNVIKIDLPEKDRIAYKEFEKEQILQIMNEEEQTGEIAALSASALCIKLLQYANGAIYDEDKNVHPLHNAKLEETKNIIEEANGKPVLIAWSFRHDKDRLMAYLKKYKPRELKTDKDIDDWNAGKIRVMLMHPASGGHGLNLQAGGNIIVWFGQTWSLEYKQQFNARLDRQGQKEVVVINELISTGTMDERVLAAIEGKVETQDALMDAVKYLITEHFIDI